MIRLSERAEEILESMWIALEEKGERDFDPTSMINGFDDPVVQELLTQELIRMHEQRFQFTPPGRDAGRMTIRRHRLAERLMMDVFDIKGEAGDDKACQFEHLLNEGVDTKLCTMLNHPEVCPHGKPIPPGECCIEARSVGRCEVVPLTECSPGEPGEIAYILTSDNKKMQKLMAMGVIPGNRIVLTQTFPSYVFKVGFSEFAIDTPLAREIFVRR